MKIKAAMYWKKIFYLCDISTPLIGVFFKPTKIYMNRSTKVYLTSDLFCKGFVDLVIQFQDSLCLLAKVSLYLFSQDCHDHDLD